mmetsp:Transcript_31921/g.76015  ORF Transcript_31921/g.76015 Transcript_31921/m.76015 type:complete len:348 (+) Transcript_31921:1236-2279(+)
MAAALSLWSSAVITTISPAHGSAAVSTCPALMVRAVQTRSTSSGMTSIGSPSRPPSSCGVSASTCTAAWSFSAAYSRSRPASARTSTRTRAASRGASPPLSAGPSEQESEVAVRASSSSRASSSESTSSPSSPASGGACFHASIASWLPLRTTRSVHTSCSVFSVKRTSLPSVSAAHASEGRCSTTSRPELTFELRASAGSTSPSPSLPAPTWMCVGRSRSDCPSASSPAGAGALALVALSCRSCAASCATGSSRTSATLSPVPISPFAPREAPERCAWYARRHLSSSWYPFSRSCEPGARSSPEVPLSSVEASSRSSALFIESVEALSFCGASPTLPVAPPARWRW